MLTGITQDQLKNAIAGVEPVRLMGLVLLRQLQPQSGEWFPTGVDTATLAEATAELIDYTRECRAACARLQELRPRADAEE